MKGDRDGQVEKDLRVLVVDDTVIDRQVLSRVINDIDGVELQGVASSGPRALTKIGLRPPDLVLLDVFMPEMDGLETLARIKEAHPNIDVVMVSGIDRETARYTMKALESGALDFIAKPRKPTVEENVAELRSAISRLVSMARTRKYSRKARGVNDEAPPEAPPQPPPAIRKAALVPEAPPKKAERPVYIRKAPRKVGRVDAVGIGVSTGGPNALQELVQGLCADFPVPILAVQHMPVMFTASLATRLDSGSAVKVIEARDRELIRPGFFYLAPGGRHMEVRKDRAGTAVALVDTPPVNSCRPSVDVLFRSMAAVFGGNVLTVILTGMGSDGVAGVSEVRRRGGYSLVQDEKSSVIWGMPGAVVEADQSDEVVPLSKMAERIEWLVDRGKGRC